MLEKVILMSITFISYSRADIATAKFLRSTLQQIGFETWLDIEELRGGQTWESKINLALNKSEALLVLLSPDSVSSKYVSYEVKTFLTYRKPIIPVKIRTFDEQSLPDELKNLLQFQLLDWTNPKSDHVSDLATAYNDAGLMPSVTTLPMLQYDEAYRSSITQVVHENTQHSLDATLHKGNFMSGSFRVKLEDLLRAGKTIRIILCESHPAVTHQLWYRSERNWDDPDGQEVIAQQLKSGYRNIDAWLRHLKDSEKRRFEVRLIPYIVPDPFYLVDQEHESGIAVVFLRNFRAQGDAAPFSVFRKSEEHTKLFKFYQNEFESLWAIAKIYS